MRTMKFLRLYLLSREKQRAFKVEFGPNANVIQAPNGFGKSVLLKSLYEAFGAEPHRVDNRWKSERAVTAVEFAIDGVVQTIVKLEGIYAIFDEAGTLQFQTSSVTSELSPYLANMLDFRLLMMNQRDEVLVPPPAYAFAPYYVDQDKSWTEPWRPFSKMYLPKSTLTLAEYHSGLKPNSYYIARADRDRLSRDKEEVELRRRGLANAVDHLAKLAPGLTLHLTLSDFKEETERLLKESQQLHEREVEHREKLAELADVRALWSAQLAIARAALKELDEAFTSSTSQPVDVECPSCGEHYSNDIAARFNIAADSESLIGVVQQALEELRKVDAEIKKAELNISAIAEAVVRVQSVLSARRSEISLGDVVASEGRNVATRVLYQHIGEADEAIRQLAELIEKRGAEMSLLLDKERQKSIISYYSGQLERVAQQLNVGLEEEGSIASPPRARGSEGPRGLAAYYYAFLHTVRKYGSATFCPIVIDEPNQQGQDRKHLPAIIQLLIADRPKDSQMILAVNQAEGLSFGQANIVVVGQARNQLLDEKAFSGVRAHLMPFLKKMAQ